MSCRETPGGSAAITIARQNDPTLSDSDAQAALHRLRRNSTATGQANPDAVRQWAAHHADAQRLHNRPSASLLTRLAAVDANPDGYDATLFDAMTALTDRPDEALRRARTVDLTGRLGGATRHCPACGQFADDAHQCPMQVLDQHPALTDVADAFRREGIPLYAVGGCVRDLLDHGDPGNDLDLCTPAPPQATRQILDRYGSIDLSGESFGTIRLARRGHPDVEITTFRRESYRHGDRKPDVTTNGVTLDDDLSRRDFTVNAIAYEISARTMVDPHHGRADLNAGILRSVGNPKERFAEDPLRTVRLARFAATRQWTIDPATRDAARTIVADGHLATISKERIQTEAAKVLRDPRPDVVPDAIAIADDLGFADQLLPTINPSRTSEIRWGQVDRTDRIAALLTISDDPEPSTRWKQAKWPHADIDQANRIVQAMDTITRPEPTMRAAVRRYDDPTLDSAQRLATARGLTVNAGLADARSSAATWRAPLPVTGHDAINLGLQGPQVGRWLAAAEARFLDGTTDRDSLLATDQP